MMTQPQVEAIKSKGDYREIIQVCVPVRFFWNPDNTFDGIEFGPFEHSLTPWEMDMITECLEAVKPAMGVERDNGGIDDVLDRQLPSME